MSVEITQLVQGHSRSFRVTRGYSSSISIIQGHTRSFNVISDTSAKISASQRQRVGIILLKALDTRVLTKVLAEYSSIKLLR